jgi:hypothetical protein
MTHMLNPAVTNVSAEMEVTVSGGGLELPSTLREGQALPDASMTMDIGSGGMKIMSMTMTMTNRKVGVRESLTTKAGTFDCYQLTYDFEIQTIFKKSFSVKEWFAKDIGMVRSETYDSKGKLEGYIELTYFSK